MSRALDRWRRWRCEKTAHRVVVFFDEPIPVETDQGPMVITGSCRCGALHEGMHPSLAKSHAA